MSKAWGAGISLAIALGLSGCTYAKKAPGLLPAAPQESVTPHDAERAAAEAARRAQMEQMEAQRARMEAQRASEASAFAESRRAYEEAKAAVAEAQRQVAAARRGQTILPDSGPSPSGASHLAGATLDGGAPLAAPGNRIACPQLGGLATPEECAHYTDLHATMQNGVAAFDPPRSMEMGRDYPVKLVIGSEEVAAQVIDSATDAGDVKTVDIRLGSWICAELLAPQFDLDGPARQCKERGLSRMLSFDWTVSPRQDGKLKLGVKVESLAEQDGKPLDVIDSRMIAVDVTADAIGRFDMTVSRLTDSVGGVRTLLLALLSALGVLSAVVWRIRNLGKKPDKDALKDLTAS